jgi:V8-like Glu-specific endopeptidase
VSKCICRVFIEEGEVDGKRRRHYFGTAFFVSETRLLTAGHNIAGVNDRVTRISISLPGVPNVVATDMSLRKIPLVECKVIGTMYRHDQQYSKDIAILDSGSFRNPDYVSLSAIIPPKEAVVDVIGYPGKIRQEWIQAQWGLKDITKGQQDAKKLLPAGSLLVTRGTVEDSEEIMSYHISTCPGMGGSCVLYQGSVIGKNFLR